MHFECLLGVDVVGGDEHDQRRLLLLRLSVANALHRERRSAQYYADAFGSTERLTTAPTTTGIRLQYETPL